MSASLEGFIPFNFSEGVPYMSVTKNGVTFNKGVIMKLQFPAYACFLINPIKKQIALQAASQDSENAVNFCNEEKKDSKVLSIRWNGKDLLNTLCELMGWDLNVSSYRIDGKLLLADQAMLFDLNEAK